MWRIFRVTPPAGVVTDPKDRVVGSATTPVFEVMYTASSVGVSLTVAKRSDPAEGVHPPSDTSATGYAYRTGVEDGEPKKILNTFRPSSES